LDIGMHRAAALDRDPPRIGVGAPRTCRGRRITQQAAAGAGLKVKIVLGAVPEILQVLAIKLADVERHAEILGFDRHRSVPPQPRRMPIAEPVPGIAQPRLAVTSTSFTWRHPPSR